MTVAEHLRPPRVAPIAYHTRRRLRRFGRKRTLQGCFGPALPPVWWETYARDVKVPRSPRG